ncbi:MAG: N-acetyl-gamma-glutamyl-phosphate reductase [Lachnospiraceae bacterium]|nr:N-acetyl-gamma-glutamyl-phosphate reductase [Lachnospiraceae bacterium]
MKKIFIDGAEGTTGLKIYERFKDRTDIEILKIDSALRKDENEIKKFINNSDITFLCLPDAAAIDAVKLVENPNTVIIDTSTAHRTAEGWTYGFPELSAEQRNLIASSKRIANPGCYATGFISLIYPLINAGLISKDYPVSCFAVSGYSGGGKKLIAQYEDPERDKKFGSARMYGWGQNHKHLKEMQVITGIEKEPLFSPLTTDYYSGMVVQIPLFTDLMTRKVSIDEVRDIFAEHYKGQKLIKVIPIGAEAEKGNVIFSDEMADRDDLCIYVTGNNDRIVVASSFDNLGKGASGAAIQNMNIVMGIDETTGLVWENIT